MKTRDDIFKEVLVRNNRTTTDGFVTDAMLKSWIGDAHTWAAGQKKWPFTMGRVSTTYAVGTGSGLDEYSFEGYKADSFDLVTIGGKRLDQLNFEDYLIMREETPDATDRVFTTLGNIMLINPNIDLSGTTVAYGQYQPTIDLTDETGKTVFTDWNEEGNEAILEKMTTYLKRREHLFDEATAHDQMATQKLEEVWKQILDSQYTKKTSPERGGMFTWFPVVNESSNGLSDRRNFKENQF